MGLQCLFMRRFMAFAAVLLVVCFASAGSAVADSAAEALDTLFAQLQNPKAQQHPLQTEQQIWALWMHAGSDAENEQLAKASLAMSIGAFTNAEKQLTTLVAAAPGYAEAWNKRATLYFIMGRYDESLADIVKTLDLEPRHFGALTGRGMIYQRQGKKAEALAAYKEALSINPNLPGAQHAVQELEKLLPDL